jgi:cysteine-rich repeat protein
MSLRDGRRQALATRAARLTRLAAVTLVLAASETAFAKIFACPAGRFELKTADGRGVAAGGTMLELSDAAAAHLVGVCPPARALGGFYANLGWRTVRVRWASCDPASGIASLRARFEDECQVLRGTLRMRSGRSRRFVAQRVPVCGDGIVGPGEDCDDANDASGDCCVACRAEPGCWIPCERTADCAPYAVCWRWDDTCRATTGVCRPPYRGQCPPNQFPMCGCDGRAYPSECAAWEAGVTVQGGDGLNQPTGRRCRCRPGSGRECGAGRFCRVAVARFGGICVDVLRTPRQ